MCSAIGVCTGFEVLVKQQATGVCAGCELLVKQQATSVCAGCELLVKQVPNHWRPTFQNNNAIRPTLKCSCHTFSFFLYAKEPRDQKYCLAVNVILLET